MPSYDHICDACQHEWEDTYSIHDDVPTVCPQCGVDGKVRRLISVYGAVKVELHGRELVEKLWKEGKDLARKARTDENLAHNLWD